MRVAISIGDINGIGAEIALKAHKKIKKYCNPLYITNKDMLNQAAKLLKVDAPKDLELVEIEGDFTITPGVATRKSGDYSYRSFLKAIDLAKEKEAQALLTLPINKYAWNLAGIKQRGHTEALEEIFKTNAIMMLGCEKLYTILHTHHIPLKEVTNNITYKKLLENFLIVGNIFRGKKIGVLALNPHAGDGGIMGDEESAIELALKRANKELGEEIFDGPLVPDTAFVDINNLAFKYYYCMYHDQCLTTLKSHFFDRSINVTLGLPIVRVSVDHGTAFNIAYQNKASTKSYIEAIKAAVEFSKQN
jgi:4-hydroxythreonine-4-phosphate dehydrogenase